MFLKGVDHSRHLSWSSATLCFLPSARIWCEGTWIVDIVSTLYGTAHWGRNDAVVTHFQNIVYTVSAKSESVASYYTHPSVECHAWEMLALCLRVSLLSSLDGLILATLPILIADSKLTLSSNSTWQFTNRLYITPSRAILPRDTKGF